MVEKFLWNAPGTTEELVKKLQSEQIILGSTDTILGLLAPVSQTGFIKLNEIKERFEKPYIILIENAVYIKQYAKIPSNERLEALIDKCWPGPLTLVFKANSDLPSYVQSAQGTVALRVPQHKGLLGLLAFVPGIFSTSANKAGEPVPHSIDDVNPAILKTVSCIVTDRKAIQKFQPSTILDVTGKRPRVIREGTLSVHELEDIYGEVFE